MSRLDINSFRNLSGDGYVKIENDQVVVAGRHPHAQTTVKWFQKKRPSSEAGSSPEAMEENLRVRATFLGAVLRENNSVATRFQEDILGTKVMYTPLEAKFVRLVCTEIDREAGPNPSSAAASNSAGLSNAKSGASEPSDTLVKSESSEASDTLVKSEASERPRQLDRSEELDWIEADLSIDEAAYEHRTSVFTRLQENLAQATKDGRNSNDTKGSACDFYRKFAQNYAAGQYGFASENLHSIELTADAAQQISDIVQDAMNHPANLQAYERGQVDLALVHSIIDAISG